MNSFNRILYLALAVYVAVLLYKGVGRAGKS